MYRRLTGEGAGDVPPVERRIANTADGDGWVKRWMSGREKERNCVREVKRGLGGGGVEEEQRRRKGRNMRRFLPESDKRKERQEGREVRDVG